MVLGMGLLALLVVIVGVVVAVGKAGRQATEEHAPKSEPSDFVAPVSSGGYAFRSVDESAEDFKARIARENASAGGAGAQKKQAGS